MNNTIYLIRLLWYILKYTVVAMLVIALFIVGFFVARDTTNVYVITTEGMELRASTILNVSDPNGLYKYFSSNYLAQDNALNTTIYDEFIIRDFKYKLKIETIWASPWEQKAYVQAIENLPEIDGEYPVKEDDETPKILPSWQRARYSIVLVNVEGSWLIDDVIELEQLEPVSTPTDEPEITPNPEGITPNPTPTITN